MTFSAGSERCKNVMTFSAGSERHRDVMYDFFSRF